MPQSRDLAGAALIGTATGMRTFTGLGVLALRGRFLDGRPRWAVVAAAGGEFLGDKSPIIPPRTWAPSLAGRLGAGLVGGHVVAGVPGALVAAAAAAASAHAFAALRSAAGDRTGVPDPALGAAEDALAVALASLGAARATGHP